MNVVTQPQIQVIRVFFYIEEVITLYVKQNIILKSNDKESTLVQINFLLNR